jgi:EAL domain-containing protein (putative c-di-GMP-specific phosphodiesterase class I)
MYAHSKSIGTMEQGKPFSATESPLVDFDAVCQKIRAAVEPARALAVSLHDEHGDVLWLSESSMGPDEHNAVREALEAFSSNDGPPVLAYDLGDSRSALLLRAVNGRRRLVGVIMVIMDSRVIKPDERGAAKFMTPKVQRTLADFVAMRPNSEPVPETAPAPAAPTAKAPALASLKGVGRSESNVRIATAPLAAQARSSAPARPATAPLRRTPPEQSIPAHVSPAGRASSAPQASPAAHASPAVHASPAARAPAAHASPAHSAPAHTPTIGSTSSRLPAASIELSLADSGRMPAARPPPAPAVPAADPQSIGAAERRTSQAVTPEIDRLHAALRRSPIALHVQRLVPLTKGSQLKRYEVLLRSKSDDAPNSAPQAMLKAAVDNGLGSMIDRRVVTELIGWLVHHPDVWQSSAVMFSVNLTTTALHDEHFIKFVGLCLAKSSLPKAMIAFEVDVPTAVKMSDRISEVAAALHRLGCPLVLDDFAMRTECFDLLRLPGVRYIKLAPEITAKMRTDKVSQAAITAVVQMARVLGMHTVAKRTESPAEQEWLTALGVDFVQSHSVSPPTSIESLSKGQKPKS